MQDGSKIQLVYDMLRASNIMCFVCYHRMFRKCNWLFLDGLLLLLALAAVAAAASLVPPRLSTFPPQGAPQPGSVTTGGGVTPSGALSVSILL